MVNCLTIGCTNRFDTPSQEGISFHKIPSSKKPLLRQKWFHNIRRKPPLPKDWSFYICSVHFDETWFKRNLQVNNFVISHYTRTKYIYMYYLYYIGVYQDIFSLFNFLSFWTPHKLKFLFILIQGEIERQFSNKKKSLFEAFIFVFTMTENFFDLKLGI